MGPSENPYKAPTSIDAATPHAPTPREKTLRQLRTVAHGLTVAFYSTIVGAVAFAVFVYLLLEVGAPQNVRNDVDIAVGYGIPAMLLVASFIAALIAAGMCRSAPRESKARGAITLAIALGITAGWLSYWQGQEPDDAVFTWAGLLCTYGCTAAFVFGLYRLARFVNATSIERCAIVTIALALFSPVVHWGATELVPPPTAQELRNMAKLNRNPNQRNQILAMTSPALILTTLQTVVVTALYLFTVVGLRARIRKVLLEGLAPETPQLAAQANPGSAAS